MSFSGDIVYRMCARYFMRVVAWQANTTFCAKCRTAPWLTIHLIVPVMGISWYSSSLKIERAWILLQVGGRSCQRLMRIPTSNTELVSSPASWSSSVHFFYYRYWCGEKNVGRMIIEPNSYCGNRVLNLHQAVYLSTTPIKYAVPLGRYW